MSANRFTPETWSNFLFFSQRMYPNARAMLDVRHDDKGKCLIYSRKTGALLITARPGEAMAFLMGINWALTSAEV